MHNRKQTINQSGVMAFNARHYSFRAAVLLGTALSGIAAFTTPVWAQTACSSNVTKSCTNTGTISTGLTIQSNATVESLTNSGSVTATFSPAIDNEGTIGALTNDGQGEIEATGGPGINTGSHSNITTLTNEGTISSVGTANGGGMGIFSNGGITTLNNSGTIEGSAQTGGFSAGIAIGGTAGGNSITMLTNSGTIEGTNGSDTGTASYGIYNDEPITTLVNTGTISATGSIMNVAIDNDSDINTLVNSGVLMANASSFNEGAAVAVGILNRGTIGNLIDAGDVIGPDNLSFTENDKLYNNSAFTITNSGNGVVSTLVGAGLYNGLSGAVITNNGTITGAVPAGVTFVSQQGAKQTMSVGIYNDTSGSINVLTNSGTIEGTGPGGVGIMNYGTITALTNTGTIEGSGTTDGAGIFNSGTIGMLVDSGTIQGSGSIIGVGIYNDGSIGTLIDAGEVVNAANSLAINIPSNANLSNHNSVTVENFNNQKSNQPGTISTLIGVGLYNALSGVTVTNSGTIAGGVPANVSVVGPPVGQMHTVGLYNDTSGSINMLTNSGTIATTGAGDNNYGIYNQGTITTLINTGTIVGSGVGVKNYGIYNLGTITTLVDSGAIEGNGSTGVGIENDGTIEKLIDAGEVIDPNNAAFIENGKLSNEAVLTLSNGVIANLYGAGLYNGLSGASITNNGTITGSVPAGITFTGYQSGERGTTAAGIYNDTSGSITLLNNQGVIEGNGSSDCNSGDGINNGGNIGTLTNSGIIEGTNNDEESNAYGINNDGGYIGTLANSGTIIGTASTGGGVLVGENTIIMMLTNSGTIEGNSPTNGLGIANAGTIGTLVNSGIIEGLGTIQSFGILNVGTIGTLVNSGTISGEEDALYFDKGSAFGVLNNTGVIAGNIQNNSGQDLTISGGTGSAYGTLTGYAGTTGTITSAGTENVVFTAGNLELNDNINTGGSVTDSGATLLVNNQVSLSGANMFAVTGGVLEVGDSQNPSANLVSNVTLSDAGMLRGHGTITGNVTNDATVYPGGSIGVLHIDGNYTQKSDGTLDIDINAPRNDTMPVAGTDYDQLAVTGTAVLGGTLNVNFNVPTAGKQYAEGQTYDILTAKSVTGTFSTVALAGPYGRYLGLTSYINAANTAYEVRVLPKRRSYTSGRFYASSLYAQNASLFAVLSEPNGTGVGYWLHGLGSFGHARRVNYNYKGFMIGRGFSVSPHLIVGGAVSNIYSHSTAAVGSNVNNTSVGAELYGICTLPNWTLTSTATVGHLGNSATRDLPGIGAGKFASNGVYSGVAVRAAYNWLNRGHLFATPYAGISYLYTNTGSGQETGLSSPFDMNLHYGRMNSSLAQASAGLTAGYRATTGYGALTSWVSLGGLGTLGNTRTRVVETLGTLSENVTAQVAPVGAFTPAIGVRLAGKNARWQLGANWQGQFARRASSQAFTLQGSYKF